MSHRVTILSILLLAGCASRGYVTEEVSTAQGAMRGEVQDMRRQLISRLDELQREVEANKQVAATADELGKVRRLAEQGNAAADQNGKSLAALTRDFDSVRQIVNTREELKQKLENAVQQLADAETEFQKHRTDVDHQLTNMDLKVDEIRKTNTLLEKRLSDFFWLQQKNLRRERESLQAEVELIDKLIGIISGVDIPPSNEGTSGQDPPQAPNTARDGGH
jgi:chromosome segregation ATPase